MTKPPVGKVFTQFVVNHINSQNLTNTSTSQLQPSVPKIVIPSSMLMIGREAGAPGVALSPVKADLVTQVSKPSDSAGSTSFPTVSKVQAPANTILTKSPSLPLGKPGFLGLPLCVCASPPTKPWPCTYWENLTYSAFIWVCACDLEIAAASMYDAESFVLFCVPLPWSSFIVICDCYCKLNLSCASIDAKPQQNLIWFWHDTLYLNVRSFPCTDREVKMCDTMFTVVKKKWIYFDLFSIVKYMVIVKHGLINLCLKQSNQSHIFNYLAICGHISFIAHLQSNWCEHCSTWL